MLRGIPTEISPDLLHALACTGHGDLIVIADDFYTPLQQVPQRDDSLLQGQHSCGDGRRHPEAGPAGC